MGCKTTVILLSSLFLLGACSKNEKGTSASSSHAKVIQTSNSTAAKKVVKSSASSYQESVVSSSSVTEIEPTVGVAEVQSLHKHCLVKVSQVQMKIGLI
ncbi:hypothetical protein [Streptococcus equinus]|uniref:hypothetical protein n=1 Tax=Streptococcus equinus TaxID=1335 RepID=UPI0015F6C400|nr:hypothetical protein [Streptococcus equinus]QMS96894.1 hypothetical protein H1R75_03205 [Streptococcus equinus]